MKENEFLADKVVNALLDIVSIKSVIHSVICRVIHNIIEERGNIKNVEERAVQKIIDILENLS